MIRLKRYIVIWLLFVVLLCLVFLPTAKCSSAAALTGAALMPTTTINTIDISPSIYNETIPPIPSSVSKNLTVDWPRKKDGTRFVGIKEYVIVVHNNLQWEKKELKTWYASVIQAENTTAIHKLRQKHTLINQTQLQPILAHMRNIRKKMQKVYHSVSIIKKHLKKRKKVISGAQTTINRTDTNWNLTISSFRTQYLAVKHALYDIKHMKPILKGKNPKHTILSLLKRTRKMLKKSKKRSKSHSKKVAHLIKNTIKASHSIKTSSSAQGAMEMTKLLSILEKDLKEHGAKLKIHLTTAIASREAHMKQLNAKIHPYLQVIAMLKHMVKVSMATIPDYKSDLVKALNSTKPILAKMQVVANKMQQSKDRLDNAKRNYETELRNILQRADTIESIHQLVKNKLLGMDIIDKQTLLSISNILRPYGMRTLIWNPYYPHNLSDPTLHDDIRPYGMKVPDEINPFYSNKSEILRSCGNWQFHEEDGNPYAIDSSGNGHDGVLHGGLHYRIKPHGGLQFDGMQQYVDVGRLGDVASRFQRFSIDLWVKTLDTHPSLSTILKYVDRKDYGVFAIEANRRVGKVVNGISAYGEQRDVATDYESGSTMVYLRDFAGRILAGHVRAPYFDNKWHRLSVIVLNATQNKMVFYMDGKLQNWVATIEQSPYDFRPMDENLFIGAGNNQGTPEGFFDGAIRSVRILCGSQRLSVPKCCRICDSSISKPCGDMCIENSIECHLPKGCSCASNPITSPPSPAPTPQPTVPEPTQYQPIPKYPRGSSQLNNYSIFPGDGALVPNQTSPDTASSTKLHPAS